MAAVLGSVCRRCGAPIMWATTAAHGKAIPLDPDPHPDGNVWVVGDPPVAHVAGKEPPTLFDGTGPDPDEPMYRAHFATCPVPR